jgi:hypothetical protein
MGIKSKLYQLKSFCTNIAGPRTWLFSLVKENLAPKAGTALAVFNVARIIIASVKNPDQKMPSAYPSGADMALTQAEGLVSMLGVMNSWPYALALIFFTALWVIALLVRGSFKFRKFESPTLFKFGQLGPYFGMIAQFLLGMLLVPLVLAGAIVVLVPEAFTVNQGAYFWLIAAVFLILVIAMHYFAFIEKEFTNSVVYTISTPDTMSQPVSEKVVKEYATALKEIHWVGSPEPFFESNDGRVVVTIPVLYNADHWKSVDSTQLGRKLAEAEKALVGIGCEILSRILPQKIQKDLPADIKTPFGATVKSKQKTKM